MALKLKLNRRAGRSDGALAFFTRHVRPAVWYYEIVALEVRLLICGALVPVTSRGLRLSIILVVICAWTTVTREMRPYINRGHMALTTYLQIFILSCVALALILYGDFLSEVAAKIFSWIVSAISVAITVRLYSAFKGEEVNKVLDLVRSRHAFARDDFLRLHVGMNVRVMDDVVFAAALAILDDEFMERPTKAAQAAGAAAAPGWAYLTVHLLPLRDVWTRAIRTRTVLVTHAPRLLANVALLVRMRARCAPAAGGRVTLDQFAKAVDAVLGPLAQELRGDVVAATFSRLSVTTEPRPTLDIDECFEPAMREILDALIRDHTTDEDDDDRRRSGSLDYAENVAASFRKLAFSKKYGAEGRQDDDAPEGGDKDTFFDLAMHAHVANFQCWVVMEEAAAATLTEPHWGARISELQDFSDGPNAVLQAPLFGTHLAAWAAELGGNAGGEPFNVLREHFDEAVLPHALRSVALAAHPAYIAALRALLREPEPGWASKCELYNTGPATAVKSAARMRAKVEEYRSSEEGLPAIASWPHAARITDPLRATIICDDAEAIVRAYAALCGGGADGDGAHPFRITRLKNKLALCTKPFNLHVNCLFDRGAGAAPITTEIQIVPRAVNVVTGRSHKFYTLSRAPSAGVMRSVVAARPGSHEHVL
ncbi:hypothetical protein M885DRAFT_540169 [Pelagophyceae sp. CCMP2097]|nr:hypothetical protein M885DRAFT_540169 [Pelagophyceae sp. CCMP2097]